MSQQEKIKFVVKNGRYAGSVIELDQDQEYSLGRSFHCDIAIDDPRFAERQMLLKIGAEGVQIKLLAEGKLAVNGVAKDTSAQSEWRSMDPNSVFVMNDLEFSLEVPASIYAGARQQQVQAEEELEMASTSESSAATQSKTSQPKPQPASAAVSSPAQAFDDVETQVPGGDIDSEDTDIQIQVVPNLADELDFDTGSEIRYRKSAKVPLDESQQESKQKYIIGGSIAAGLAVIVGAYFFIGQETPPANKSDLVQSFERQIDADPVISMGVNEAGDEIIDETARENGFSPFLMQDAANNMDDQQVSFTDPEIDDPFTAYDRLQSQSEVSDTTEDTTVPEQGMSDLEQALGQLKSENESRGFPNPGSGVLSPKADVAEAEVEAEVTETEAEVAEKQDAEQLVADVENDSAQNGPVEQEQVQGSSFGQLSENQAAELNKGIEQQQAPQTAGQKDSSSRNTQSYLAVLRGEASPATIVVPAARDLLDGLGLGYLSVSSREPREGEVPPVIAVSGYVDNRQMWMRAKEIVRQDIQELGTLVDNVSSPEVRKAQLDRWIAKSDIKDKVQTYLSERGLIAKVNLNPSQVAVWQAISKQYVKKFDNQPELFVMRDPGDWLKIQSISFGARPYLVTQSGAVLLPGAKLDNGYSIVAIRRSGIELRDQFGSYTYVF